MPGLPALMLCPYAFQFKGDSYVAELPEAILGQLLTDAGMTLAVAESCTGGLIGHRITDVAGSSSYFLGGVVAYSYSAKERILKVNHDDLYDYGAVSEEVARQMADGVRRLFGVDLAVAVTGIAGPGGGLPGKPVGLVYIALSARNHLRCEKFIWSGDREANKASSADAALKMLLDYLSDILQ
jgi:PncC family amidohydrolase